jgi:surface protein
MSMIANNGKKVCFILSNGNVVTKIMKDEKAIWELEGDMLLKFAVDVAKGTAIFYNDGNFLAPDNYKAGDYVYFSKGTFHPTTFRFAIGSSTYCNYYSEIYMVKDFDFSKVTSMWIFTYNMPLLTKLDVSHLDTSKINSMDSSFRNLGVKKLDVSNFDTSKVTTMNTMFYGCSSLTSLDVSNFDTSKVTNMQGMFHSCRSLTSLDVSNFDTSKVTNMFMMFYNCTSLTSLNVSNFDTSKVTNIDRMFYGCPSLTSLDVSNFDTSKVTDMVYMFYNCSSLTSLDVSNFDTSKVTNMQGMFHSCRSLTSLDVSNFDTSKVTNMGNLFNSCRSLTNLIFGSKWGAQTSTEANALTLDLSYLGSSKSYKLTDDTYNSMLTMYDRASNGLTTMTIKFSKSHNLPDGFAEKMSALGYTITLV